MVILFKPYRNKLSHSKINISSKTWSLILGKRVFHMRTLFRFCVSRLFWHEYIRNVIVQLMFSKMDAFLQLFMKKVLELKLNKFNLENHLWQDFKIFSLSKQLILLGRVCCSWKSLGKSSLYSWFMKKRIIFKWIYIFVCEKNNMQW